MTHRAHLLEDRLLDCYLADRHGEALDPRLAEHLADCPSCSARYADLASFMDRLYADGAAETDAIFTPERLRAQQQQIARRLELTRIPARVIMFPRRFVRDSIAGSTTRTAGRWVAAAAAAGLFIGVAVGASFNLGAHRETTGTLARQTKVMPSPALIARPLPATTRGSSPAQYSADDVFLNDLEVALERPHTKELIAFDALTPHVREVRGESTR